MTSEKTYNVGIYCRLSNDDERDGESVSIENQKLMLQAFVRQQGWNEYDVYCDDGYSGTNFNRPGVQRLIEDAKAKRINLILVKDFSRFGRNYVECADYLEKLFPFLGTRFISVADNYDTGRRDEDKQIEVAMKNIVNSYYSQDLSKKITSTFNMKRQNGEFFFCPPFGYIKDEKHPGKILIDEEAAEIVRYIFKLACEGRRITDIAKRLNSENIPTRAAYNRMHGIKGKGVSLEKSEYAAWTGTKVRQILTDEQYIGTYVGQKTKRVVTGMSKTVRVTDSEKIPNNHPAIVDTETFEKAQELFTRAKVKHTEEKRYLLLSS